MLESVHSTSTIFVHLHYILRKRIRMKHWLVASIGFILILFASCLGDPENASPSESDVVRVGQTVPSFTVSLSDGSIFNSSQMGEKPACIVLFNTTCSDCQRELPIVQSMYEEFFSNVRFVCISRAEAEAPIKAYWTNHNLSIPYSAQPDRSIYNLFALSTIPRLYIVNSSGKIVNAYATKVSEKELRRALEASLYK